ncbi:MAG: flavin-containing monooxygenase [Spongiibacteraceae bacterium]
MSAKVNLHEAKVAEATRRRLASTHTQVVVVGAGFAGIGAAIKLREAGMDFLVLEKSSEVGGVWRDNSYPDCACDIPSALYSYSFAPNPNWSRLFADQPEIKDYTHDTVRRFKLGDSILLNHDMLSAKWHAEDRLWELETNAGLFTANFVIMACGPMHKPLLPVIKGADSFPGAVFHSARWDHSVDLTSKRIAVIGTGASAIQFVPALQKNVERLSVFQRTPPWVVPKADLAISARWQHIFKRLPIAQKLFRTLLYWQFEMLNSSLKSPRLVERLQKVGLRNIYRAIKDPVMREKLTPNYAIGCKRILQSNTWYRALAKPNVDVLGGVSEIQGNIIISADGSRCEADVIIYATGFEVANPPVAEMIFGASGKSLAEQWSGSPEVYLGTVAEDCPNCFLTFGPNLYTFSSAFVIIEAQLSYIMSALKLLKKKKISTIRVDALRSKLYNQRLQSDLQKTVWNSGGCTSYFIDKNGRNSTNWPWTTFYMRMRLRRFKLSDYSFERAVSTVINREGVG